MFKDILFLFKISSYKLKIEFLIIEIISILNGFLQGLSIISIGPFILLLTNKELALDNFFLNFLYNKINFSSYENFILFYGFFVIFFILSANLFFLYANLLLIKFGFNYGENLQRQLFKYYINQSLSNFSELNTSELIAKIYFQTYRVCNTIIVPILDLLSKIFICIIIIILMFYLIDIQNIILVLFFVSSLYVIIYIISKKSLLKSDQVLTNLEKNKYKILGDSFRGIHVLKTYLLENYFILKFNKATYPVATYRSLQRIIASSPKFLVEMILFSGFVVILMIFIRSGEALVTLAPKASIILYAIYKLTPNIQSIFYDLVNIRGNISSINDLKKEFIEINKLVLSKSSTKQKNKLIYFENIHVDNLQFEYEEKYKIENLSFKINRGSNNFLIGPSGSGKSTIAKLLLGFNDNYLGKIFYNNLDIKNLDMYNLYNVISYVHQSTFLFDESILFNITFKNSLEKIDIKHLDNVIKNCQLDEFINSTEEGLFSKVGEDGIKISGGQKQRIGIARALYKKPQLLIFDEATNSLDSLTEMKIFDFINQKKEITSIVITHNYNLLKISDNILFIDNGKKIFEGKYNELLKKIDIEKYKKKK